MKLTDLRIGNWIEISGNYRDLKDFQELSEDEVNPIALIPETMKSIGFKRHVEHYTLDIDGYVIKWINLPQFKFPLTISHQGKDDFLHLHHVRFVHQLQNIIKCFTNQELEFDLCKEQKHSKKR